MSMAAKALRAYASAQAARDPREQEAEVFRHVNALLRRARVSDSRARARAVADNGRLWNMVIDLVSDPQNALPAPLRAAIVSVGLAVQREAQAAEPDFDFLIGVNENIAAGLAVGSRP